MEKALESLRQRHSELVVVDSEQMSKKAILLILTSKVTSTADHFQVELLMDYPLEIGSGQFIPGFEEQLIGMNVGEEKDIVVTFPRKLRQQRSGR